MKTYKGFAVPDAFGVFRLSIPMQNLIYRAHCEKKGFNFEVSANELIGKTESRPTLLFLLDDLTADGVILVNRWMLPSIKTRRIQVYRSFLSRNKGICLVEEDKLILTKDDFIELELSFIPDLRAQVA